MANCDIVTAAVAALESDDPKIAAQYFTEDFVWISSFPNILDKQRFLQMMLAIKKGFPDYSLNIKVCQEVNDRLVRATLDPVGTHTGVFALPLITPVQPTGLSVALPRHAVEITLHGDKICRIKVEHPSGGGLQGLLEWLGVEVTEELLEKMFK